MVALLFFILRERREIMTGYDAVIIGAGVSGAAPDCQGRRTAGAAHDSHERHGQRAAYTVFNPAALSD